MTYCPASKAPLKFRPQIGFALALVALTFVIPGRGQADPTASPVSSVSSLFKAYASMPGLEAHFREEKHIALLAMPLASQGTLYFSRPHFLLRQVESPSKSSILITPQSVLMRDTDGEKTIDLRAQEEVRPFIQSLLWILSGNLEAIKGAYRVSFSPTEQDRWTLTLAPHSKRLSEIITRLKITGQALAVVRIEVEESNGNRTVTTIDKANPKRRFSPDEMKALFHVQPAQPAKP